MIRSNIPKPDRKQSFVTRLLDYEICPTVDPRLRALSHPLAVLSMAAVAALLCGFFVAPQGYVLCGAISTVIAIGCLWPWLALRGVDCQLRFHGSRAEEDEPTDIEIVIQNRWPWPVWGIAIAGGFERSESVEELEPALAVAQIGGWSRTQLTWPFVPEVRGRYPLVQPQLMSGFPFGIWQAKKPVKVLSHLIVWPRRFRLPPMLVPSGKRCWAGHPSENGSGRFGQRSAVRAYRRGDSMRQIHWRKTALHDRLISYDQENHAAAEALISLDTDPALHRGSGSDASMEWAIRIAASVCAALVTQHIRITLVAHAGRYCSQGSGGSPAGLLDWLATLETNRQPAGLDTERARSRCRPGVISIHITTNHSHSISGDSIVVATDLNPGEKQRESRAAGSWMTIARGQDVASQVRSGWQRSPGRRRRAV